jgi:hypothetical protein
LRDYYLMSGKQYFSYIHDGKKLTNNKSHRLKGDTGSGQ